MKLTPKQITKLFFGNNCFYHITPTDCIPGILENGLEKRNQIGICTVIINEEAITKYIIESQLRNTGKEDFSIIKICPQKHQLFHKDLVLDGSPMISNPLHLYINRERIFVFQEDIIGQVNVPMSELSDLPAVAERMEIIFNELTEGLDQHS